MTGQLLTHQTDAEVGEARVQVEANLPVLENVDADYVACKFVLVKTFYHVEFVLFRRSVCSQRLFFSKIVRRN